VEYLSSLESKVVELVLKCLKKVLGEMPPEERVTAVVRNALAVTRNEAKVTIRVCPGDKETVESRINEIIKPYPGIRMIDVVADLRLSPDGCVLETEIGVVEASLEGQIQAIENSLSRSVTGDGAR
jgi:type III secretion protein L